MLSLTSGDALSSILGWVSIACWVVVYSPQILENYQKQSGEGLSLFFVFIWLVGDLCNLVGAILERLLPTIKILATYYIVCDCILLIQIYYYRWKNSRKQSSVPPLVPDVSVPPSQVSEETPLLASGNDARSAPAEPMLKQFVKYAAAVVFVFTAGIVAWYVDERIHRDKPRTQPEEQFEWRGQLLGWISAVLFVGARIPQIVKNLKTRCEGLSPALFIFAISGNTTYTLSILAASLEPRHIAANAAWLAGSTLTVFLDIYVLVQFFHFQAEDRQRALSGGHA